MKPTPRQHLAAVATLLIGGWMLLMGTPLFDTTVGENYARPEVRAAYRAEVGWPLSEVVIGVAAVNRCCRDPVVSRLGWTERPLSNLQYWNLYPIWGTAHRQFEVWVDGEVVHRSQDPEATWMNPVLREHRIAYEYVESTLRNHRSVKSKVVSQWLVDRAREDFPDSREVELRWLGGPFPGYRHKVVKRARATAPDWVVSMQSPRR